MNKEVEEYLRLQRKIVVLEYARVFGSNLEAYKACGIPRSTFYDWEKHIEKKDLMVLNIKQPMPEVIHIVEIIINKNLISHSNCLDVFSYMRIPMTRISSTWLY